jgi:hypothetical protein
MSEMMQGGGLPPELMALLGGAGAGGDAGMAPEPEAPADPGADAMELIRQALELIRQYAAQEESEQGTLDAEKISTLLQQILAAEEKELDDAMQGKASPKMLRSAYGG